MVDNKIETARDCPGFVFINLTRWGGGLHCAQYIDHPLLAQLKLLSWANNYYLLIGEGKTGYLVKKKHNKAPQILNMLLASAPGVFKVELESKKYFHWSISSEGITKAPNEVCWLLKEWDRNFFSSKTDFSQVWQTSMLGMDMYKNQFDGVPTLEHSLIRGLSAYNVCVGGDNFGPYNVKSSERMEENLGASLGKMFREKTKPNLKKLHTADFYYGMVRFFKLNRDLDKEDFPIPVRINVFSGDSVKLPNKDAGLLFAESHKEKCKDYEVVYLSSGSKPLFEEAIQKTVHRIMVEAVAHIKKVGKVPDHKNIEDILWKLSPKVELFTIWDDMDMSFSAREAMKTKMRIFFIPNAVKYVLDFITQKSRMMFERGRYIQVGMKWLDGGAAKFYDTMNGNKTHRKFRWYEGDWSKYDLSILAHELMIYNMTTLLYYEEGDNKYKLFQYIVEYCTSQLVAKVVRFVNGEWRMIIGVMPSGDFNTSHGDSWIQTILWFTYVRSVERRIKALAQGCRNRNMMVKYDAYLAIVTDIQESLRTYDLMIAVYGDDYLMCVPESLVKWINGVGYGNYMKECFYMEQKASTIKEYTYLLTEVDHRYGEIVKFGPKFLKRYLINFKIGGKDTIVAFRPTRAVYFRCVFSKDLDLDIYDSMIRLIGMAWDTMGTNLVAYSFCSFMYDSLHDMAKVTGDMDSDIHNIMLKRYYDDPDKFTKYLKKVGNIMFDMEFPSLDDLLRRNMMRSQDHNRCNFNYYDEY